MRAGMVGGLMRRAWRQASVAMADPERFARNLTQITHPKLFEAKLVDILQAAPLNIKIDEDERRRPALNVLQPILSPQNMTGGPNTIVTVAAQVAALGIHVRILTTKQRRTEDPAWFWSHIRQIVGQSADLSSLEISPAHDALRPATIGRNDIFLATHWTTAQQVNAKLDQMRHQFFFYLIQDYEPGFYPWSSNHALAAETYSMNYIPIVNEELLANYLITNQIGRFSEPSFRKTVLTFEPAIDRTLFMVRPRSSRRKKRVLVYTRPSNFRNMLGVCIMALRAIVKTASFDLNSWEFVGIGGRGSVPTIELGSKALLTQAPWHSYQSYAHYLSDFEILLCLMLSPHTSYPVPRWQRVEAW